MKIIYAFLLSFSLAFSVTLTPEQLQLAKAAGYSEADIKKQLEKQDTKKVSKKEQIIVNDIESNTNNELDKDFDKSSILENDSTVKKEKKPFDFDSIEEEKQKIKKEELEKEKRYGSNFFNNKNTLNPYSIPVPLNYRLNHGDKISLKIYGALNNEFELDINKEGKINIPQVKELKIIGLTFSEAKTLILEETKKAYPNSTNILFDIVEFSSIQVTLSGLVNTPGLYNLSSFSTIKDALQVSGGVLENGSFRNIHLKRAGRTIKVFDLYKLIRYGNTSNDVLLQNGDVILVKPISKSIKLSGDVNYDSLFELKKGESFRDLISFAAGLKASANKKAIKLKRFESNTQKVYTLSLNELYKMTPKDGDSIHINSKSNVSQKYVLIKGNVFKSGEKQIPKDKKLSSLLKSELKQFGKNAYFKKDTLYSFAIIKNDNNIKTFNLQNILDEKEDIKLKIWDEITIFKKSELKNNEYIKVSGDLIDEEQNEYKFYEGMKASDLFELVKFKTGTNIKVDKSTIHLTRVVNNKLKTIVINNENISNFKLKAYDEVRFFNFSDLNDTFTASIKGEVFLPGDYNVGENTSINDIVKLAGGFTKKALMARFEIARYYTKNYERKREVLSLDMNKALKLNLKVFADDEITIFPIANWSDKKYVELKGLVKYPGKYAIEDGEKLSSVILRAGGFRKEAFVEGAVFTREEVRVLQEKRMNEALSRLSSQVVKSNANGEQLGENKKDSDKKIQAVEELEKQVKNNKPIGRISLNLYYDLNRFKNSTFDLTLKDKDTLYIPAINDTVSVVGEVLNQNTFVYNSSLNTDDYLQKAGGITELANEDYIYIVKANGETMKYESNYFWGDENKVFKGDTIVVPIQYDTFSDIKFAKDVSSILYQLAVTAASLKTVGGI